MTVRWGLSVLDWTHHAIDERADHPNGCYRASCGHLLIFVVPLEDAPYGKTCEDCAAEQYDIAIEDLGRSQ